MHEHEPETALGCRWLQVSACHDASCGVYDCGTDLLPFAAMLMFSVLATLNRGFDASKRDRNREPFLMAITTKDWQLTFKGQKMTCAL